MRLNIKNFIIVLAMFILTACSGGGNCNTNVNPNPTITPSPTPGELSLSLSAPDQYPAGLPTPITAYLTMTNTSTVDANNLVYAIPSGDNHTGVTISVENGSTQPCLNIPAGKSCTFPAVIDAYANPGSFKVTATPNGTSSISKALFGNTLSLTANIGLTDVPVNANSGANGISFLYAHKVAANSGSDTKITIVGVVSSATAGDFNTINLTDASGKLLNFQVLSGNSGNGLTNLTQGSIVTFLLTIPANNPSYSFYAQTMHNGTTVNQGSDKHIISLADATAGVLVVQPTEFKLSASESYTSQIITYTNIGNGEVTNLRIAQPEAPITMQNNCTSTLAASASCTVVLSSTAAAGVSGSGSLKAEYASSDGTTGIVLSQYNYKGINAVFGLDVEADDGFDFVTDTIDTTTSKQVTITNTGNVSESNFVFTFEDAAGFTISSGTSGTACTVTNGNTVAQTLRVNDSCTVTLTYTSTTKDSGTGRMVINYLYNGNVSATPITKTLSYETVQSTASLGFNPASPYRFDTIIANNMESITTMFTITNHGSDIVSGTLSSTITGTNAAQFTILPSTGASDCQTISNLGVGATCTLNVRFGATSVESTVLTANLTITGSSKTGGNINTSLVLNGATRSPISANPVVTVVYFTPAPKFGNGYEESQAFQFESMNSPVARVNLDLTYKNIGPVAAESFTIESTNVPVGYVFQANTCKNVKLESNSANSCKLSYYFLGTVGNKDLNLADIKTNWTSEETGPITDALAPWNINGANYNMIYANVYPKPVVNVVLSSESTGSPVITDIDVESSFYVVFKLSGGYIVPSRMYTATAPNTFTPTTNTCSLSSESPICSVKFTAPATAAANQNLTFTTPGGSGTITPTPASLRINVMPVLDNRLYIFVTGSMYDGNLGGFSGANDKCNNSTTKNSLTVPTGTTWKALLAGNNATISGQVYKNVSNVTIATATGGDLVGDNSLSSAIGASVNVWTGADEGNCNNWTHNGISFIGDAGLADSSTSEWWFSAPKGCDVDDSMHLYCVQQLPALSLSVAKSSIAGGTDQADGCTTVTATIPAAVTTPVTANLSIPTIDGTKNFYFSTAYEGTPSTTTSCIINANATTCTTTTMLCGGDEAGSTGDAVITGTAIGYTNGSVSVEAEQ